MSKSIIKRLLCVLGSVSLLFGCNQKEKEEVITGGVIDQSDVNAPKKIESNELVSLEMKFYVIVEEDDSKSGFYTFSLKKSELGDLLLTCNEEPSLKVKEEVLVRSQEIIREYDLVKYNGVDRITAGLPDEYQPCHLKAEYASGEKLSFVMNNEPRAEWAGEFFNYYDSLFKE